MKKILNITIIAALFGLMGCEDVTDQFDGLDDRQSNFNIGKTPLEGPYVLTEEDYALSSNKDVNNFKNFSESLPAKDYVPEILNKNYYTKEAGIELRITYDYYSRPSVDEDNAYEISNDEYKLMGQSYSNFTNDDLAKASIALLFTNNIPLSLMDPGSELTAKYVIASQGDTRYVKVNDDFSTEVLSKKPDAFYTLSGDDYDLLGERYPNFYSISDAQTKIAEFAQMAEGKGAGNYACVVYRSFYDRYAVYKYDGTAWSLLGSVNPKSELFKFDGMEWSWIPPIKFVKSDKAFTVEYELTDADYELVGNGRYYNFDVREGKDEESEEVRIEKISKILKTNFEVALGQVYKVSFKVYSGQNETWDLTLEAVEDN
ncbi:hypothetical protein SAMN06265379_101859 [Saccharicrinis carchari]|uniref:DUF5017 domain-containing protein n=1 Tax=Saccharicrinis carchari TaxID=1168039 RepID=A0A521BCS5_SACCC|nr:hypothetical protein [Saccharicrinis carchari]SMO44550.1 hypothetical protein SAMN06265379_101859 [Saccharicrinis carchari]